MYYGITNLSGLAIYRDTTVTGQRIDGLESVVLNALMPSSCCALIAYRQIRPTLVAPLFVASTEEQPERGIMEWSDSIVLPRFNPVIKPPVRQLEQAGV